MQDNNDLVREIRRWMEILIMRSMHGMSHFARSTGLSMPQFSLLMRLYHGGTCDVQDIGRHFDVSSAAASQLVDRLVQSGFVVRQESPDDRRVRMIALDERGRALVAQGIEERYRWVDELVQELPAERRAAILEALPALMEAEKKLSQMEKGRTLRGAHGAPHESHVALGDAVDRTTGADSASRGVESASRDAESASRDAEPASRDAEPASRDAIKTPRARQ